MNFERFVLGLCNLFACNKRVELYFVKFFFFFFLSFVFVCLYVYI